MLAAGELVQAGGGWGNSKTDFLRRGLLEAGDQGHARAVRGVFVQADESKTDAGRPTGSLGQQHRRGQPWAESGP